MTVKAKRAIKKSFTKNTSFKGFQCFSTVLNGFQCFITIFDVFNRLSVFALFHRICRFQANKVKLLKRFEKILVKKACFLSKRYFFVISP